jgi:hypothetical protein
MDMWVMSYKLVMWLYMYVVITGHNRFVDLYVCEVGLGLDPMHRPPCPPWLLCRSRRLTSPSQ